MDESEESDGPEHMNPMFRDGIQDDFDPLLFPPMNSWRSANDLNHSWAPAKNRWPSEHQLNSGGSFWRITSV